MDFFLWLLMYGAYVVDRAMNFDLEHNGAKKRPTVSRVEPRVRLAAANTASEELR